MNICRKIRGFFGFDSYRRDILYLKWGKYPDYSGKMTAEKIVLGGPIMNTNKNHIQTAGSSAHIMYYKIAVTKTLSTEKLLWKLPIIDVLLYIILQFTNTTGFSFFQQVAGGFISFFTENPLSAAL